VLLGGQSAPAAVASSAAAVAKKTGCAPASAAAPVRAFERGFSSAAEGGAPALAAFASRPPPPPFFHRRRRKSSAKTSRASSKRAPMLMPATVSGGSAAAPAGAAAGDGSPPVALVAVPVALGLAEDDHEAAGERVEEGDAAAENVLVAVNVRPPVSVVRDDAVLLEVAVSVQKLCVAVAVHTDCDADAVPVAVRVEDGVEAAERVAVEVAVAVADCVGGRHVSTALSAGTPGEPGRFPHVATGSGDCETPSPVRHSLPSYSTNVTAFCAALQKKLPVEMGAVPTTQAPSRTVTVVLAPAHVPELG